MRFTPALVSLLSLCSSVSGYITGFRVPKSITPGTPFTLFVTRTSHHPGATAFAAERGISPGKEKPSTMFVTRASYHSREEGFAFEGGISRGNGRPGDLGEIFVYEYLRLRNFKDDEDVPFRVSIPENTPAGEATLAFRVVNLFSEASKREHRVKVMVGNGFSREMVQTVQQNDKE